MTRFGLSEQTLATVRAILADHPEIEQAILYGSRAKGTYSKGFDIDLTLVGDRFDHRLAGANYRTAGRFSHTLSGGFVAEVRYRQPKFIGAYRSCRRGDIPA